jgi:hypothetical protein
MTYNKPEVVELGNAALVIQGSKSGPTDLSGPQGSPDCELDD